MLPQLQTLKCFTKRKQYRWLTLGLIEGEIAPEIDALASNYGVETAYRYRYPYLEIKLTAHTDVDSNLITQVEEKISAHIVSTDGQTALLALKSVLDKIPETLYLNGPQCVKNLVDRIDHASILYVRTDLLLKDNNQIHFEFHESTKGGSIMYLSAKACQKEKINYEHRLTIPNRGKDVSEYLEAYIAWQIIKTLNHRGWLI